MNGIATGFIPYGATFLMFYEYAQCGTYGGINETTRFILRLCSVPIGLGEVWFVQLRIARYNKRLHYG